jgi:hypothetical protein
MTVDEIITAVKAKGIGRTRHTGMEPFWDEVLVEEIERLRNLWMIFHGDLLTANSERDRFYEMWQEECEENKTLRQAIREFLEWENAPEQENLLTLDGVEPMLDQTEKLAALLPENQENVNDQITQQTPDNQE